MPTQEREEFYEPPTYSTLYHGGGMSGMTACTSEGRPTEFITCTSCSYHQVSASKDFTCTRAV